MVCVCVNDQPLIGIILSKKKRYMEENYKTILAVIFTYMFVFVFVVVACPLDVHIQFTCRLFIIHPPSL